MNTNYIPLSAIGVPGAPWEQEDDGLVECPLCHTWGHIPAYPKDKLCPACHGEGWVYPEKAEAIVKEYGLEDEE